MKKLILKGFGVTAFVFLCMWGVQGLSNFKILSAFDPISQALQEFELTDWVFSKLRPDPKIDPRIVLVNIGPADRRGVAQIIQTISQYKPKVIGIDSFFDCEGGLYDTINCPQLLDTLGNLMLSNAIQEAGNVVLVSRLLQSDSVSSSKTIDLYDSMETSDPMFSNYSFNAYANLPTGNKDGDYVATYQEDVKICKSVFPKIMINGKQQLAFSVQMAMLYDSVKTKKFLARNKEEEIINFKGNIYIPDVKIKSLREQATNVSDFNALCYAIDWPQFERGEYVPEMFRDNVVIIGFLGDYFGDPAWDDKFFTPLNTKVAGRANPDMFGLVIHANVVEMILTEDYVDEIPEWLQIIIAIVVCFLNVLLFYKIDKDLPVLYDGLSVVIQIIEIIIVAMIIVQVFATYNLKLELSLTFAALALIGPCFDVYKSLENTVLQRLTMPKRSVLTTQNPDIS
jgi:CHASE2 domain-containing sensor protein